MLQPKIADIEALPDYKLKLFYVNGEKKLFDVQPYICGDWFGQLLDVSYFKTVHVLTDGSGIEWADGQEIAPHELYDLGMNIMG